MTLEALKDRLKFTQEQIAYYATGKELNQTGYDMVRRICELYIDDFNRVFGGRDERIEG